MRARSTVDRLGPQSSGFVWHLEDVLEVYTRPYDPRRPVICMAQRAPQVSKQVIGEARVPLPMRPEQVQREDYEHARGAPESI